MSKFPASVMIYEDGSPVGRYVRAAVVTPETSTTSMDEAWSAAVVALPESKPPWMLTLHTYVREPDGSPFVEACAYAPMYEQAVQVFGDTVVDALLELAIDLRALRVPA